MRSLARLSPLNPADVRAVECSGGDHDPRGDNGGDRDHKGDHGRGDDKV